MKFRGQAEKKEILNFNNYKKKGVQNFTALP